MMWSFWLMLILDTLTKGKTQLYSTCPFEDGTFYTTSPECLVYFRCENHMLWTGVCFPWQRFDVHSLSCRKRTDVDCNPEYAGVWRPVYLERNDETKFNVKDAVYQLVVNLRIKNGTERYNNFNKDGNGLTSNTDNLTCFQNKIDEEPEIDPVVTEKCQDIKSSSDDQVETMGKNKSIEGNTRDGSNEAEMIKKDLSSTDLIDNENGRHKRSSISVKQEDSGGSFLYWCGSGRIVVAQSNQDGDEICTQLQDPEFINEEGISQQGDMAGHTFLGSDVNPL